MIDWLGCGQEVDWTGCKDEVYPLSKIKEKFEVREICKDGFLVLSRKGEHWIDFAAMEWFTEFDGESETYLRCVFHGGGTTEPLREFRHTHWGDNGYIFYANGVLIVAALTALNEFFDVLK